MKVGTFPAQGGSLALFLALAAGGLPARSGEAASGLILAPGSPARQFVTWRTPVTLDRDGKPVQVTGSGAWRSTVVSTEPPPQGWQLPGFQDRHWSPVHLPRRPDQKAGADSVLGDLHGQSGGPQLSPVRAVTLIRARFRVTTPSALDLALRYRGGAAVYVNGREVTRRHLPAGELTAETLAEDYPEAAFESAPGKPIPFHHTTPEQFRKNLGLRVRALETKIDAGMLTGRWNEVADALAATLPRLYAAAAEAAAAPGAGGS